MDAAGKVIFGFASSDTVIEVSCVTLAGQPTTFDRYQLIKSELTLPPSTMSVIFFGLRIR